jgi:uncharacterized protein (DUF58 family)
VRPDRPIPAAPELGRWWADPRLPGYLLAGFGALVAAVATGRAELAALGAPFVALAAAGVVDRRPPGLRGRVELRNDRVVEGDLVHGEAHLEWEGDAEVAVMLAGWRGVTPVEPESGPAWSLPAGRGPVTLPFRLRARSWGVHDLGSLWVRVRRPGGLLVWEQKVAPAPGLRVLPTAVRLDRLLTPAEPRAVAGMHLSRLRGHGTDFAELRPYRQGDRLRDLSWATSARLGEPWVTVHHPERTGTVLILLDTFFGGEGTSDDALTRAARLAWALASVHLRVQDRVGLLGRGRAPAWVPPQGGRRARWLLLDELLAVGGLAEAGGRRERRQGRVLVPGDALIVGVTSLRSRSLARDLVHYRRIGHATGALVIDTSDLPGAAVTRADAAARRLWFARREVERHALERSGVPTALVRSGEAVGSSISALRRRMRALERAGRGGSFR